MLDLDFNALQRKVKTELERALRRRDALDGIMQNDASKPVVRKKVVFAGHDLKFIRPLLSRLESEGRYEIQIDDWSSHSVHDEARSRTLIEWADIIFCEWGLGNAEWYSRYKRPHQRLIVRMHAQERKTVFPKRFTYENIDAIVAISPYILEEFRRIFKIDSEKMRLITNYVDTTTLARPKDWESARFTIGVVGVLPSLKRLDLALDTFEQVWSEDPRFRLVIKSRRPEQVPWIWNNADERYHYQTIQKRINEAAWADRVEWSGHGDDMASWYEQIGFILSTSDFESFHLAVAEGMASGAYPVIRHWDGAETIYRREWIMDDWSQAPARILTVDPEAASEAVKQFVHERYDIDTVYEEMVSLMEASAVGTGGTL
ncbi:glycosyltransferase [Exiguobacterium sp. SH0S1]|uniref:glycosyltransferase family 4 protein n=1 Tax=Exiguobacterium sp. SH0S1 TaxID=2510949 RepID=UPI0010392BDE|nr:glycosyltransferase family 4 protein [Exiguobacterium sp. SH0S1]TCI77796.1 glycosyltransferase [Exiguobacterium sp. SH0S1]